MAVWPKLRDMLSWRGWWRVFCGVGSDCPGSGCWGREERLNCGEIQLSSSACGLRPKEYVFAGGKLISRLASGKPRYLNRGRCVQKSGHQQRSDDHTPLTCDCLEAP